MPRFPSIQSLLFGRSSPQSDWGQAARTIQQQLELSVALLPRLSVRAKRIVLRFKPAAGLEVVIPQGLRQQDLLQAVGAKREWIENQAARLRARGVPLSNLDWRLPDEVVLADWPHREPVLVNIAYRESSIDIPTVSMPEPRRLLVVGKSADKTLLARALAKAIAKLSKRPLLLAMEHVSKETGMQAQRVRIACQRARWGSCSAKGIISLNFRLAMLPYELTRYVMLHELCHLEHLHHGPAFWQLLADIEPRSQILDKTLGQSSSVLPGWILAAGSGSQNNTID